MPIHSRYTPSKKTVLSEDHIVKYDNRIAFIDRLFLFIHDDTFLVVRTKIDPSPTLPASGEGGIELCENNDCYPSPRLRGDRGGVDLFMRIETSGLRPEMRRKVVRARVFPGCRPGFPSGNRPLPDPPRIRGRSKNRFVYGSSSRVSTENAIPSYMILTYYPGYRIFSPRDASGERLSRNRSNRFRLKAIESGPILTIRVKSEPRPENSPYEQHPSRPNRRFAQSHTRIGARQSLD